MIAIDEVHLYAMHGRSFFVQIRQLLPDIFSIIYSSKSDYQPLCLLMTATVTHNLLALCTTLTDIPRGECLDSAYGSFDWDRHPHQM